MWKWMFSKVIKMREKVAIDLGGEVEEKPFLEHLEDLRVMLIRMALTLTIFAVGTFAFYKYLWGFIAFPIHLAGLDDKIKFFTPGPMDGFVAVMNLSIAAGVVMASPLLLFFLLQFVLPGLRTTEKKVIFPALAVGAGLFFAGAAFAYFVVAPKALSFFYSFNHSLSPTSGSVKADDITMWGIAQFAKFICQFVLLFGLCFELPVVVMALVKLDILSYKVMKGSRTWAAIGITAVSAVIAPSPDPQTMVLIAGPLYLLYEICIWLARYLDLRDRKLFPEYYKDKEEDEKALANAPEWDNDSYNPWNDDNADEEEKPAPRLPPAGTQPMSDPHAVTESSPSVEPSSETTPPARPFTLWTEESSAPPAEIASSTGKPFTLWTEETAVSPADMPVPEETLDSDTPSSDPDHPHPPSSEPHP